MNGRGRPRKAVSKSETIHVRVTAAQKLALLAQARAAGVSLAELILGKCLPKDAASAQHEQLSVFASPLDILSIHFPQDVPKVPIPAAGKDNTRDQ